MLLDLCFLEDDVLTRLGVVFAKLELFRRRLGIFLCRIEIAGPRRALELDQYATGLGHGLLVSANNHSLAEDTAGSGSVKTRESIKPSKIAKKLARQAFDAFRNLTARIQPN